MSLGFNSLCTVLSNRKKCTSLNCLLLLLGMYEGTVKNQDLRNIEAALRQLRTCK